MSEKVAELMAILRRGYEESSMPKSVPEAFSLLEEVARSVVEPLIDEMRRWALSGVDEEERKLAENALRVAERELNPPKPE
jgi:hypothetical protein